MFSDIVTKDSDWIHMTSVHVLRCFVSGNECYIYFNTVAPVEYMVDEAKLTLIDDDPDWKTTAEKNIDLFRKADITLQSVLIYCIIQC